MTQAYSNPKRESDPHALPDVEVWFAHIGQCPVCDTNYPMIASPDGKATPRESRCDEDGAFLDRTGEAGWFYWFCFPGCLPDSEPVGPFATEAEALADAREGFEDGDETENDSTT